MCESWTGGLRASRANQTRCAVGRKLGRFRNKDTKWSSDQKTRKRDEKCQKKIFQVRIGRRLAITDDYFLMQQSFCFLRSSWNTNLGRRPPRKLKGWATTGTRNCCNRVQHCQVFQTLKFFSKRNLIKFWQVKTCDQLQPRRPVESGFIRKSVHKTDFGILMKRLAAFHNNIYFRLKAF